MAVVKGRRRLSRREKAELTRDRIIESAYRLFSRDGFEATTMQAIADGAGVAVQTVYFVFRTKAGVLAAVEPRAIPGGDAGPRWREEFERRMAAATDGAAILRLWLEATTVVLDRITSFVDLVGPGIPLDPESVARRSHERDRWFELLIGRLQATGNLRSGLTSGRALDIARTLVRIEGYREARQAFGWPAADWQELAYEVLAAQLLA